MPQACTRALVITSETCNEQDKNVLLLTRESGLVRAFAPGASRLKNRFASMLEPFSECDFQYYWKEGKERITLSRGDLRRSYFHLVSRPENVFHFSLMAEILIKTTAPNLEDDRIYRLLKAMLDCRENGVPMSYLLLYYLFWIISLQGLMFQLDHCSSCHSQITALCWLRDDYLGLLCPECRQSEKKNLSGKQLELMRWIRRKSPQENPGLHDLQEADNLVRLLAAKLSWNCEVEFKACRFIREFQ